MFKVIMQTTDIVQCHLLNLNGALISTFFYLECF